MTNEGAQKRQLRVVLLKRLLIAFLILGVVLPILLCVLLYIKVGRLESRLQKLEAEKQVSEVSVDDVYELDDTLVEVFQEEDLKRYENLSLKKDEAKEGKTKVYLTFDDGPGLLTGKVLDILKEKNVKATFFVIAREEPEYAEIYQRIVEEGHTLGMHSYTHKYQEIYSSEDAFWQDLTKLQEFLYDTTEVWPRFYRFPGGSSNHVSKLSMETLTKELVDQDIFYLDWNVSAQDATSEPLSARQIANNVIQNVCKYDTAVVLLHDAPNKKATVEALPIIIDELSKNDQVVFLAADEEMQPIRHLSVTE